MKNHWSIFISVIWVIEFLPTKIKCFKCYLNQSNFSKLSVWCARIAFLWACLELPAEMFVRMWEISNNFAQSYAYTGEEKFVWCACGMTENSFRPTILYGLLILKIKTLIAVADNVLFVLWILFLHVLTKNLVVTKALISWCPLWQY